MKENAVLLGQDLGKKFIDAGLVPKNTKRIILDMEVNEAVRLYFETLADERVSCMSLPEILLDHFEEHGLTEVKQKKKQD